MPFFRSNFNSQADDVISLAGDTVAAGETVLSSDTKKPYKNETAFTVTLSGGTVADLVADGLTAQPDTSVTDIEQYIAAVGPIKGLVAISANAGTLSINAAAGTFTYLETSVAPNDIQEATYTLQTPLTFDLYKQDGLVSAAQTLVPVTQYDDNGTVTLLAGSNDATIHELWADPKTPNSFILLMGQTNYATLNSASNDLTGYTPLLPAALAGWMRVGRIIARRDTVDLAVSTRAEFHNANRFGEVVETAVVPPLTGATALVDGIGGAMSAPLAGQNRRFLRGDAVWSEAVEHVFLSNSVTNPAAAGSPTATEALAAADSSVTGTQRGALFYYTGDDIATNPPTYIWHINESGEVKELKGRKTTAHPAVIDIAARDALVGADNGDLVVTAVPPVTWLRVAGAWQVWDSSEALAPVDVIDATTGIFDNSIDPLTTGVTFRVQNTAGGTPADTIIGFPTANLSQADELYIELLNTGGGTLNALFNSVYKNSNGTADIGTVAFNTGTDPKSFIFRRKTIAGAGLDEYWLVAGTEYTVSGGLAKLGTITADPATASEGIYTLDASAGAFTVTLPAATGTQSRIMLDAADVETNAVTVAVQAGENLNGVVDDTQAIATNQSIYLLIDEGAGDWVLKELGQGSTSVTLHQAKMRLAASMATVAGDNDILLDTTDFDTGGMVSGTNMTIVNAGRYQITGRFANSVASNNTQVFIRINGAKVARSINSQSGSGNLDALVVVHTADLAIGDIVILGGFTDGAENTPTVLADQPSLEVLQLPTVQSVPSTHVQVADLNRIQVSPSTNINNSALTHYAFDTVQHVNGAALSLNASGAIDGLQAGRTYKITANIQNPGISSGGTIMRFVDLTANAQIGLQWQYHSANDTNLASDLPQQIAYFTPGVTTSVGVDFAGGAIGEIGVSSTFMVEEVPTKTVIDNTNTPYTAVAGVDYTSIEIGDYRDLTFEVQMNAGDGNVAILFPIAFSAVPKDWDVQLSSKANSGQGAGAPAMITGTLTAAGLTYNRVDSIADADGGFVVVRVRGLK